MTDTCALFLYGTLCDLDLLEIVAGEHLSTEPASLADHAVFWADGQSFPVIVRSRGAITHGILIEATKAAKARLDFYEIGFGYRLAPCEVEVNGGRRTVKVYDPEPELWPRGARWSLTDWQTRFGILSREAAQDYMRLCGRKSPQEAAALFSQVRGRAASRLRAQNVPTPVAFEPSPSRDGVIIHSSHRPFVDFFDLVEENVQFQTFAGMHSAQVQRITLIGGDAVTVLPYDPATDSVLIIRQFRHGAYSRGDLNPWCVEPAAGRIDPFETPEDAALRELHEETGVVPRSLHRIAGYYPTPAAVSEHLTSFVATADLTESDGRIGGLAGENEDIMSHVVPFETLMKMVESGAANTGPLVLTAFWLQSARHTLV